MAGVQRCLGILEHHLKHLQNFPGASLDASFQLPAIQQQVPRGPRRQAADHPKQRCLPASAFPNHPKGVPLADPEGDAIHGADTHALPAPRPEEPFRRRKALFDFHRAKDLRPFLLMSGDGRGGSRVLRGSRQLVPSQAGAEVARAYLPQGRGRCAAPVLDERTARGEDAARGQPVQTGNGPRDARKKVLSSLGIEAGNAPQEAQRVGMKRGVVELPDGRLLEELPRVHHAHPVAQLRDNCQVMRDVEDC